MRAFTPAALPLASAAPCIGTAVGAALPRQYSTIDTATNGSTNTNTQPNADAAAAADADADAGISPTHTSRRVSHPASPPRKNAFASHSPKQTHIPYPGSDQYAHVRGARSSPHPFTEKRGKHAEQGGRMGANTSYSNSVYANSGYVSNINVSDVRRQQKDSHLPDQVLEKRGVERKEQAAINRDVLYIMSLADNGQVHSRCGEVHFACMRVECMGA